MTQKIIVSVILSLTVFSSCSKPSREPVDVTWHSRFSADMEKLLLGGSGVDRVWDKGDFIGVFGSSEGWNVKYVLSAPCYSLKDADFFGPRVSGEEIAAYFPYDEAMTGSASGLSISVQSAQEYDPSVSLSGQFLRYCTKAYAFLSSDDRLHFEYPLGVLTVKVSPEATAMVTSVRLVSEKLPIAGNGEIRKGNGLEMNTDASGSITLSCGEGVNLCDADIRFVLPPASYPVLYLEFFTVGGECFSVMAPNVEIRRISDVGNPVTQVHIGLSGPGAFSGEDGYLDRDVVDVSRINGFTSVDGYLEED